MADGKGPVFDHIKCLLKEYLNFINNLCIWQRPSYFGASVGVGASAGGPADPSSAGGGAGGSAAGGFAAGGSAAGGSAAGGSAG